MASQMEPNKERELTLYEAVRKWRHIVMGKVVDDFVTSSF